jgi:hypothetical protein
LSENIASLNANSVNLLLRNQEVWTQTEQASEPTGRTTRGDWFTQKIYSPLELHAHLFFFEGSSNGGLFWRTSIQTKLQVGSQVTDAGLQEYCRCSQIQDNLLFEPTPLCYWAEMPIALSLRNPAANRIFGRGTQSLKMNLIQKYGFNIVKEAEIIAKHLNKASELELSLLDALVTGYKFRHISKSQALKQYFKSYAKYQLIKDPLKNYFLEYRADSHLAVA